MKKVIITILIVLIVEWAISAIYEWYIIGNENIVLGVLFPITMASSLTYIIINWKK